MLIRHVIALLLLIVTPLIAISWLGISAVRRQQQQQDEKLRSILTERLVEIDRDLQVVATEYQESLALQLNAADRNPDSLRLIRQRIPIVRESLLVDRDGGLIYPRRPEIDDAASIVWYSALTELARTRPVGDSIESTRVNTLARRSGAPASVPLRWQTWYFEGGLQLVLWMPRSDQTATGVVLERGRWMSDLIAALPDQSSVSGQYVLRDGEDRTVYRWGTEESDASLDQPLASVRLSSPWSSWRLIFADADVSLHGSRSLGTLPLLASIFAIGVSLALLGIYVMTSLQRQSNLAAQRVSFAGHVSHELRTPLTNIRLYAELAKRDLAQSEDAIASSARRRIDVIEEESQRLSRIVAGVLEIVSGKGSGSIRAVPKSPDDVIQTVLENFAPAFERLQMEVVADLRATENIELDEDVVDLTLVNLLSNVEKYAGEGSRVEIISRQTPSQTIVDVVDNGPGIKRAWAKKIFEPFVRLDDSLSAPAGTGLGLAIARSAARRHGGDLVLIATDVGAHFRFTIPNQHELSMSKSHAGPAS